MGYIITIIILVVLCIVSFRIFEKDILSPTFISGCIFLFSVVMALIGRLTWNNVQSLSWKTISIITTALISFGIGEFIVRKYIKNTNEKEVIEAKEKIKIKEIKIKKYKFFILCGFMIITLLLLIIEIHRINVYYGNNTWNIPKMLNVYRMKSGLFSNAIKNDNIGVNFVVKQMQKLSLIMTVFLGYIFINNFFVSRKNRSNYYNIIPITLGLITTFTYNGGRSLFFHICISLGIITFMLYRKISEDKINKKIIIFLVAGSVTLIVLFFALQLMVGRNSKVPFTEYISFYFGTSIPSLEIYIQNGIHESKYGGLTFKSIFYVMDKLNIIEYNEVISHNWISFKGTTSNLASNVYTSFMNYYNDFNIVGVAVLQLIFGAVFTTMYLYANKLKNLNVLIFFAYYYYIILEQIRDETFYCLINSNTIANIICIFAVYYVLFLDFKKVIRKGQKDEEKLHI